MRRLMAGWRFDCCRRGERPGRDARDPLLAAALKKASSSCNKNLVRRTEIRH